MLALCDPLCFSVALCGQKKYNPTEKHRGPQRFHSSPDYIGEHNILKNLERHIESLRAEL